jgi:hypothetical protein
MKQEESEAPSVRRVISCPKHNGILFLWGFIKKS